MVNGIGNPNPDLSRLAGILARPGIGPDAGEAGASPAFSLPADNTDTENLAGSGLPRPVDLANDGGTALLRGMSEDIAARARFLGATSDVPLPDLSERRPNSLDTARRTYTAVSTPAQEVPVNIGDTQAAALFQPTPRERISPAATPIPSRSRLGAVIPVLAALVLVLLLIYVLSC